MFDRPPSFPELGLPAGYKVLGLAYHEPTSTVVTHVGPFRERGPRGRLYFRWATDARYQPVLDLPDRTSIDSLALDPAHPGLYFLTATYTELDGGRMAGDWDALYRFDLGEHRCERLAGREDLVLEAGYERGWLCELLGVSADGRTVICKAGQQTQPLAARSKRVDYSVARFDLGTQQVAAVAPLVGVFA